MTANLKNSFRKLLLTSVVMLAVPNMASAQSVDSDNQIIDEGMNRSEVMDLAHELVDGIGPRLTNSPKMREAEEWAMKKFAEWGLVNIRREGFRFDRGYSIT